MSCKYSANICGVGCFSALDLLCGLAGSWCTSSKRLSWTNSAKMRSVRKLRRSRKCFLICFRICFDASILSCRHWLPLLCCNSCWKFGSSQNLVAFASPETKVCFSCSTAFNIKLSIPCNVVGFCCSNVWFKISWYKCGIPFTSRLGFQRFFALNFRFFTLLFRMLWQVQQTIYSPVVRSEVNIVGCKALQQRKRHGT